MFKSDMYPFMFNQHSTNVYKFITGQRASAGLVDTHALLATDSIAMPQLHSHWRRMVTRSNVWFVAPRMYDKISEFR